MPIQTHRLSTIRALLKYAAPDKGLFRVLYTKNARTASWAASEEDRADHWICDGKSVFQYIPKQKQLVEHKLPPELQGKAIVDSPLPFLFGTEAQKIRQRYFIRIIAPPPGQTKRDLAGGISSLSGRRGQLSPGNISAQHARHDSQGPANLSTQWQKSHLVRIL